MPVRQWMVFPKLLLQALQLLLRNDPLRMAGATAFFTTFALPPILIILIQLLRLFLDPHTIRTELFGSLRGILGDEAVRQVVQVLMGLRHAAGNGYIAAAGLVFLVFVATTLFKIIKGSINQLWRIRVVEHRRGQGLRSRLASLLIILSAGLLFVLGLLAEGLQVFVDNRVSAISPVLSAYFTGFFNHVLAVAIQMLWFLLLFRFLSDGRPDWPVAAIGALVTALLFMLGRVAVHWLLSFSTIGTLYGRSASVVLLLLFVFYSALILYFGAAFTRVWGKHRGRPIRPRSYAARFRIIAAPVDEN